MKILSFLAVFVVIQPLGLSAQVQPVPGISETVNGYNLDWHGYSDRVYFIQYSTNLTNWSFMPVIESGQGVALGYGFSTAGDRLFLRLKYIDVVTSNPSSDDFDGDNISNWDEVRIGGTGTDPLKWDTSGDGKSDYFSDRDYNDLADGWELQYYGSIGTANPDGHSDDDWLTNREESLMGSDPTNNDTDSDLVNDNEDAVWWDIDITWPRSKEVQYTVVELEGLNLTASFYVGDILSYDRNLQLFQPGDFYDAPASEWGILSLSNAGHVLVQEDLRHPSEIIDDGYGYIYNTGILVPGNIADSMRNHVWSPDTGSWNKLNSDSLLDGGQTVLAVATDVSATGEAIGYAWVPLKDSQGNATQIEKTIVRWLDISPNEQADSVAPLTNLGIVNSSFTDLQSAAGASNEYPALYLAEDGSLLNLPCVFDYRTRSGDTFIHTYSGDETRFKMNNAGTGELVAHGGEQAGVVEKAVRIKHIDNPSNVDIAALSQNGLWARRHHAWRKIEPHPTNPISGGLGVSEDFTVLLNDGKTIMRNGKTLAISTLVPSTTWTDFRMEHMNDRGMMVGRAKRAENDKVVILVPVEYWQPKLDSTGSVVQENGADKLVPVDSIRPSRWLDAWVWDNNIYQFKFDENFVESDPDRFYIRTPMALQTFDPTWMSLMGLGAGGSTKLNFEEISEDGKIYQQSKGLILVLDEADDTISLNPAILGSDDGDDDLTHRVMQDDSPMDVEMDLLASASIGGSNNSQWLHPQVKQPTHDLDVELVFLVEEAEILNYAHHQFYENRALIQVEAARAAYGRIGIDFKHSFRVQSVPQNTWDSVFGDALMTHTEGLSLVNLFGMEDTPKPIIFLVITEVEVLSIVHGYAHGLPSRDEYGHVFISLEGSVASMQEYTIAHEIGHVLGHMSKGDINMHFEDLRPYPASEHVDDVMAHNLLVGGGVSRHADKYDDSKRINLDQQNLFSSSEFIKKK